MSINEVIGNHGTFSKLASTGLSVKWKRGLSACWLPSGGAARLLTRTPKVRALSVKKNTFSAAGRLSPVNCAGRVKGFSHASQSIFSKQKSRSMFARGKEQSKFLESVEQCSTGDVKLLVCTVSRETAGKSLQNERGVSPARQLDAFTSVDTRTSFAEGGKIWGDLSQQMTMLNAKMVSKLPVLAYCGHLVSMQRSFCSGWLTVFCSSIAECLKFSTNFVSPSLCLLCGAICENSVQTGQFQVSQFATLHSFLDAVREFSTTRTKKKLSKIPREGDLRTTPRQLFIVTRCVFVLHFTNPIDTTVTSSFGNDFGNSGEIKMLLNEKSFCVGKGNNTSLVSCLKNKCHLITAV